MTIREVIQIYLRRIIDIRLHRIMNSFLSSHWNFENFFMQGVEDGVLPKPLIELVDQTLLLEGYYKVVDEIVYKVKVTFPDWEPYYVHINRKNLSGLFSSLQMKKFFGRDSIANTKKTAANGESASKFDVPHKLYRLESTRSNTVPDSPRFSAADEDKFGKSKGSKENNVLGGMTRLLFVPAFGGPARIKRIREERVKTVLSILDVVTSDEKLLNSRAVREFFRISNLTFDARLGHSFMEGWVKIRAVPRTANDEKLNWTTKISCMCCVCAMAPKKDSCTCLMPKIHRFHRMWAVVKRSFIAFYDKPPQEISPLAATFVLSFTQHLEIYKGYGSTGSQKAIVLVGDSKTVKLKLATKYEKKTWSSAILNTRKLSSNSNTDWGVGHLYQSFAPKRGGKCAVVVHGRTETCHARWLIDGKDTYAAIHEAIKNANYQIFIMGWWICPDMPLIRPAEFDDQSKLLGGILSTKAAQGVKVFILMYNEVTLATSLDTSYQFETIKKLEGKENIYVIRHPEHKLSTSSVWFWSHHEKLVVVDQHHAFCGGIDLSWGRYDTSEHGLYNKATSGAFEWPGIDFSNVRVKDFSNVSHYQKTIHPIECPRMPWHDVHCEHWGAIARDIARHFVQQWNHARFSTLSAKLPELIPMDFLPDQYYESEDDVFVLNLPKAAPTNLDVVWEKEEEASEPNKDVESDNDTIIDELDFKAEEKNEVPNEVLHPSSPVLRVSRSSSAEYLDHLSQYDGAWNMTGNLTSHDKGWPVRGQVLRSRGLWSGNAPVENEISIQHSMIELIDNAKSFIYIENQFFISGLDSDEVVINRVTSALFKRILRAHESNAEFKVYIMLPLLPGFEGSVLDSPAIRRVLYYQYKTICRGEFSLYQNLLSNGIDPDEYIGFFALRKWESYLENLSTELIYVHSKVMIIDDTTCIIGSGNINDRSLVGYRDSEVAVVMSDDPKSNREDSFVKSLRVSLFNEHWSTSTEEIGNAILNPGTSENFKVLKSVATRNTELYEQVFENIIPSDRIRTAGDLKKCPRRDFISVEFTPERQVKLSSLMGHVVEYPLLFLSLVGDELKPVDTAGLFLGEKLYL